MKKNAYITLPAIFLFFLMALCLTASSALAQEMGKDMGMNGSDSHMMMASEKNGSAETHMAKGEAIIKGTALDPAIEGTATFEDTPEGLQVHIALSHVAGAGKHGIHIHAAGDCGDNGKNTGGHFNPLGVQHGLLTKDGLQGAHVGDMGNITVKDDGTAEMTTVLPGVKLASGNLSVAGRAVILHAKEDDFGQPTGNAGGRIACGPIIVTK